VGEKGSIRAFQDLDIKTRHGKIEEILLHGNISKVLILTRTERFRCLLDYPRLCGQVGC
jgi:hypothetical protein